jgi:hypothetical protein
MSFCVRGYQKSPAAHHNAQHQRGHRCDCLMSEVFQKGPNPNDNLKSGSAVRPDSYAFSGSGTGLMTAPLLLTAISAAILLQEAISIGVAFWRLQ